MSVVASLADAITRQEGATRNNNPGNIWDGGPNRIWPNLPIDSRGFVIYPTPEAGRVALENDLTIKINRGMTLESLITQYAPPSQNDTATYIANVSTWTGLPMNVPLNQLDSFEPSAGGGILATGFDPNAIPDDYGAQDVLEASTFQWGTAVLGIAGLGLWLAFSD